MINSNNMKLKDSVLKPNVDQLAESLDKLE